MQQNATRLKCKHSEGLCLFFMYRFTGINIYQISVTSPAGRSSEREALHPWSDGSPRGQVCPELFAELEFAGHLAPGQSVEASGTDNTAVIKHGTLGGNRGERGHPLVSLSWDLCVRLTKACTSGSSP